MSPNLPKRVPRRVALLSTAAVVAGLAGLAATNAFASEAVDWTVTDTPAMDSNYSLRSTEVLADDDVWAVGYTVDQMWNGTVALHWDGKAWEQTPTPEGLALTDVSAANSDDVWAVGVNDAGGMTARWDGSKWTEVPSPPPDVPAGQKPALNGVDYAQSGGEAWAVGCASNEDHSKQTAFAQHWDADGSEWKLTELPVPDGVTDTCLESVEIRSATEAWAVGRAAGSDSGAAYILRWDGEAWSVVEGPDIGKPDAHLTSVIAPAVGMEAAQIYAAGFAKDKFGDFLDGQPILFTWDGKKWTSVETPETTGWVYGIGPDGAGGVFITGYGSRGASILLRYDGSTVTSETPPVQDGTSSLYGTAASPEGDVWVVGDVGDADEDMKG
ncbi:MAG: hypothetical protein ACRDXX_12515, partial [Stackebrandtia sp.]